jgi:hypothetical protein
MSHSALDAGRRRLAIDQLGDHEEGAILFAEVADGNVVGYFSAAMARALALEKRVPGGIQHGRSGHDV